MVCLVHDNVREVVSRKRKKASLLAERLNRANCHRDWTAQAAELCLFQSTLQTGSSTELVRCLGEQFSPVGKDQYPVSLIHLLLCDLGKDHRLAAPGGKHQQSPLVPHTPFVQYSVFCLSLVRPELHHRR